MNILTIDTATEACSVALQYNNTVFSQFDICPQQHSQRILPMVESVLAEANIKLDQVDLLGFGRGPGSFTGVRIATGIVQGLALGAEKPVVGVSTLAAMAQQVFKETACHRVAVAIDARMNEVYFAQFTNNQGLAELLGEEQVIAPEKVAELVLGSESEIDADIEFAGTGWEAYSELSNLANKPIQVMFPAAQFMLSLVLLGAENGSVTSANKVTPTYVRDTVTWKKLPGR